MGSAAHIDITLALIREKDIPEISVCITSSQVFSMSCTYGAGKFDGGSLYGRPPPVDSALLSSGNHGPWGATGNAWGKENLL